MGEKKRVLILCTGNSARSQMAEGLLRHDAGELFEVESAGTHPGLVRPEAVAVMRELGIDISKNRSKHVDEFSGESFDYVITVCDNARESCPAFFGDAQKVHHNFKDPAALVGSEVPIRLDPTRRKTCEHRWARSFSIDNIPVLNRNPHFNVPSDVQLHGRRRVRRPRTAKQEGGAWTTIPGTSRCARRTTLY
jgi:arsenate reductase (thioredoxin)